MCSRCLLSYHIQITNGLWINAYPGCENDSLDFRFFPPLHLFVTSQNLLMYSSVFSQCDKSKRRNEKLFMSLFVHNDVDRPGLLLLES